MSGKRATGLSPRQMFVLDNACLPIRQAFVQGKGPLTGLYLVGSVVKGDNSAGQRDVDVRLMLADDEYAALVEAVGIKAVRFLGLAIGQYLASVTGLPIDFQFQQTTTANEKHGGGWRNPIGTRGLDRYEGDAEYRIPPASANSACTGASDCPSRLHVHGCYADLDGSACDDPEDHDSPAMRLAAVVTHTRTSTELGPDYCAECSEAISDWVAWPCPRSSRNTPDQHQADR